MQKQKRGKRAGLLTKLRANANQPAIPSLFLSNVRALDNKMDLLRLRSCQREMLHCSVLVLTEMWLNNMPDSVFELDGRLLFHSDRDPQGRRTLHLHKGWCTNCSVVGRRCSEAVEQLTAKCHPHYLPREFTAVFIVAVYFPPQATASDALKELHNSVGSLQNKYAEALCVVAGDFNLWICGTFYQRFLTIYHTG